MNVDPIRASRIGSHPGIGSTSSVAGSASAQPSTAALGQAARAESQASPKTDQVNLSSEVQESDSVGSLHASGLASAWGDAGVSPATAPDSGFKIGQGPAPGFSVGSSFNSGGGSSASPGFGAGSVFTTPPLL